MDIFNSTWLIKMLEKSSQQPRDRILNLFNILEDWLDAPEMHVQVSATPAILLNLTNYLAIQAQALGAANPSVLAEHIVLIAYNAAIQKTKEPNSKHLAHAKKAAQALILAQTQKDWVRAHYAKPAFYGIAASCMIALGIAAFWLPKYSISQPTTAAAAAENNIKATVSTFKQDNNKLTALDAATMYAKFEQMRNGTCHFPEALQIPDKHKAVYIESVVGGKLPADLADLAIANTYLEKVRCNYTPMLMANSK